MATREKPTPETLHKLLRYDPATGQLFWRERGREFFTTARDCAAWNTRYAGYEVGSINQDGYRQIKIFGRLIKSHRAIWAMQTGAWPSDQIDHKDHNRDNNRWKNLRVVTNAENLRNQSMRSDNTSGIVGVVWDKPRGKWRAYIGHEGRDCSLGRFDSITEAAEARAAAERKFGFHKNHGVR